MSFLRPCADEDPLSAPVPTNDARTLANPARALRHELAHCQIDGVELSASCVCGLGRLSPENVSDCSGEVRCCSGNVSGNAEEPMA
eukprot:15438755-Alexandrium_andersonii.AAC.2